MLLLGAEEDCEGLGCENMIIDWQLILFFKLQSSFTERNKKKDGRDGVGKEVS